MSIGLVSDWQRAVWHGQNSAYDSHYCQREFTCLLFKIKFNSFLTNTSKWIIIKNDKTLCSDMFVLLLRLLTIIVIFIIVVII